MRVEVDLTPDTDPNLVGEIILKQINPDFRWGYETREMVNGWVGLPTGEIPLTLLTLLKGCLAKSGGVHGVTAIKSVDHDIRGYLYWDGDGTLVFDVGGDYLVNDDMKSSYGWEWNPSWANGLPDSYYEGD